MNELGHLHALYQSYKEEEFVTTFLSEITFSKYSLLPLLECLCSSLLYWEI
jgi:hypothetical protein